MVVEEYTDYDGLGLARLVKNKEVSARELALAAAQAIERVNPQINAVVETYVDRIEDVKNNDLADGPFKGVPFLIKDIIGHQAGRKIECGSRLCQGMYCEQNTYYGHLLQQAGFNILGRSNTPEFSLAGTTENVLYGDTSTPWKMGFSAGGSTGGGAASVAAGIVPVADGSDIAGSIRVPASYCGVVGLKPSRGRISAGPQRDEGGLGFSVMFGLHKSVRDLAVCLDCLSIPQPGDPFILPKPEASYGSFVGKPMKKLKIGYSTSPLMDAPVDSEVAAVVQNVAVSLTEIGHSVVEESPVFDHLQASRELMNLWFAGFDQTLQRYANKTNRKIGSAMLEPITLNIYEYAKSITMNSFLKSLDYVNCARRKLSEYFSKYDVWLSPTAAQVAEPHGTYHLGLQNLTAEEYIIHSDRPIQFAVPYNLLGAPAISLPLGQHSNGLPIGVQFGTAVAKEHILIQLASMLEMSMPWKATKPPLHASN